MKIIENRSKDEEKKIFDVKTLSPVELREAKMKDIKERIENGEYKVDSSKIAEGILKEALKENLKKN